VPEAPAVRAAPGARPGNGVAAPGAVPNATRAEAAGRVATGLESLSAHAINGLNVGFNADEAPCNVPFRIAPCGPTTTISLSLAPGAVGGFEHVTGTGGALAQFLTTLSAVADNGLAASSDGMAAVAEAIARTKGSTVTITLPAIDYGFAGSFDEVAIDVNGQDGDELQAIGPRDEQPGPGWVFPLSGRVTIEEFTPFVMRGNFSAPVVNVSRVDWDNVGDDPVLDISETVTGSFVIGATWRSDPRTEIIQAEDPFELAARDLAEFMPVGSADVAERARAATADAAAGTSTGYVVQPMTPFPACDCSCAPSATFASPCDSICEPAVLHCAANDASRSDIAVLAERNAAVVAASDGLRGEFDAFMAAQNYDPGYRAALLDAFDQQTSARDQRNFVRSMGMPLEQIEEEVDPALQRILNMTREEYIAELKATKVPEALHAELLEIFDEYERQRAAAP
jgi:hypothetical protein